MGKRFRDFFAFNIELARVQVVPVNGQAGGVAVALEGMRDLLKGTLGRSLNGLSDEDKLAAAWPVACGKTMAGRGTVTGYEDGVVRVQVEDGAWLRQLTSMRGQLAGELARIAGVRVGEIHFEMKRNDRR
jgi:predicted nucleic acid-binding Zn ribbon protein